MTTETLVFKRNTSSSPVRGMTGVIGVELRVWFPWRLLWLVVIGLGVFALVYVPWRATSLNQLGVLINFFLVPWIALLLISAVSLTEGSVLGEIDRGTAAWLTALPITRPSIILSKFIGAAAGLAAVVAITGFAVYPVLADADGRGVVDFSANDALEVAAGPIGHWGIYISLPTVAMWATMLAAMWLVLCFVVAVMMLFGSLLRHRTAVFGLGLLTVGVIVSAGIFGGSAASATPAGMAGVAIDLALGNDVGLTAPIVGTLIATAFVLVLAVLAFRRRELS